ncbi:MAG: hypothetical protein WAV67_09050 [Dokdonella sp.]
MNIRNTNAISFAIAVVITAVTATGLIANAEASYDTAKAHAALTTQNLQRMPTIVVMSEPEYQRMEVVVVTANPSDYDASTDNSVVAHDWTAPARSATTQLIRNASFDMPYYSFGTAKMLVAKE